MGDLKEFADMTSTFVEQERARAVRWKHATESLPDDARRAAPYVGKDGSSGTHAYDFCIPLHFAEFTLLPDVRVRALELFGELQIPWHAGVANGPSNHLLSSQVQCVNALARMVDDPSRIAGAFASVVDIDRVLEIEPGRFLTFEYIGPEDLLGESRNGRRVRGANCTSVDAAFLHQAVDGAVELVLVEWKYTEAYRPRTPDALKDKQRAARYQRLIEDPDGPVRHDVLPFDLLLDEPLYQLVRQQLLADQLERSRAEGADRVRVVHVLPPDNTGYQESLTRPAHRSVGMTTKEIWSKLLRRPDRFCSLDPRVFADPEITSREYALRYSRCAAFDEQSLLTAFDVQRPEEVEEVLYAVAEFDGDVSVHPDGVELILGRTGTVLEYPFLVSELIDLADEVDRAFAEEAEEEWDD